VVVHKRHLFAAEAAAVLQRWARALCAGEVPNSDDIFPFKKYFEREKCPEIVIAASLRALVETISQGELSLRTPHPYKITAGGIQGAVTMFVVCSSSEPEGTFDKITPTTKGYYLDGYSLMPLGMRPQHDSA